MGSHSAAYYSTQVNEYAPSMPARRLVLGLLTPEGWKAELTLVLFIY